MRPTLCTLVICTTLVACTKASDPTPAEPKIDARSLARAAPGGDTAADRMVAQRQKALASSPNRSDAWVMLGRAWVRKARASSDPGFYLNARAAADVALELTPDHLPAMNLHGLVFLNNHDFSAARDLARSIIDKRPDNVMAHGTLADALLELGDYEAAEQAVLQMMRLKPNLPSYSRMGYLRWIFGDTDGAKQAFRLAFDSGRGQRDREPATWALTEAATLFWHEGDHEGALAGYDLALRYYPEYPPALVGKARILLGRGDAPAAVKALEIAFSESPLANTAWLLGDARLAAGDTVGADEAYADVLRIGRQGDTRTLVAYLAAKNRDVARALKLARKEADERKSIESLDGLAWAAYRAGHYDDALTAITAATRFGTPDAKLMYHHGAILVATGKSEAGLALIDAALARNPTFDTAAEARGLLKASRS